MDRFRLKIEALGVDTVLENKRGIMVIPRDSTPYIIFMNNEVGNRWLKFVRNFLVKRLLTLAETIARW